MPRALLSVRERISQRIDVDEIKRIRKLWIDHSRAEDARDLQGLIDTLADACVYEVPYTGQRWEGHAGARAFYTTFLTAFPDVHFDVTDITIGPQGVIEVARMTGSHRGVWNDWPPLGRAFDATIMIYFPWNPREQLFDGEKVWYDFKTLESQLRPAPGAGQ
jgi:predicted ester cyclase